jgi:hypothetical protein
MNFILNHQYADGNTPIRAEEAEQLIPQISTMGELNEYPCRAAGRLFDQHSEECAVRLGEAMPVSPCQESHKLNL